MSGNSRERKRKFDVAGLVKEAALLAALAGGCWWCWKKWQEFQKKQKKSGRSGKGPKTDRGGQSVISKQYDANEGNWVQKRTTFESQKGKVVMKQEVVKPGGAKHRKK